MGTSTDRVRWRDALLRKHVNDPHPFILTLEAIEALGLTENRPPTYREVAKCRGLTVGAIQHHTKVLDKAGLLVAGKGRSPRRLQVVKPSCADWLPAAQVRLNREGTKNWSQDDIVKTLFERLAFQLNQVDLVGSDIEVKAVHKP